MTTASTQLLIPAEGYLRNVLPEGLIDLPEGGVLDSVWMEPPVITLDPVLSMKAAFLIEDAELVLAIPGLDAVSLVLGSSGQGTWFRFGFTAGTHPVLSLTDMPITLRLRNDLLKPAREVAGTAAGQPKRYEVDPTRDHLDIVLAEVGVTIDFSGGITVSASSSIDLPPCMIGDSGVVVEARDVALFLDPSAAPPPGRPPGWTGVHIAQATLSLPGELAGTVGTLQLTDASIGNGGFTGTVSDTWTPALSAQLFGIDLTLASARISFVQNAPVECALHGTMTVPFFDQPLGVDLSIGLGGDISVALSATQPAGVGGSGGLLTFAKPGVLEAEVDSLALAVEDGTFSVTLSGSVRPLVADVQWPKFAVKALTIDSHGNVRIDGGWLDLSQQYSIEFFGFRIDVTRLGFGQDPDGGRWVGFSGGITLVEGMTAGASVDGLRITWHPDGSVKLTLEGIAVELEIPDTLRFHGSVAYHEIGGVHRFDGAVTIELIALDLRVDGQIVIGSDTDADGHTYTFFALYLGAELPAGIPLWSTGLGLYGIAGLIAIDMAPNKGAAPNVLHPASRTDEEWYENVDGSPGWYKRAPIGITDLRSKWDPLQGAFALGGGVTLGTVADNGFTFASKVILVVSLPGPVILIEGKANLLKERATLSDDPIFRALAVLDFRAGTFLVGLDAKYKVEDAGEILDIAGGAEFFFSLSDASAWHLYVGQKDPKERRILAHVLSLFEANAYFMIDATMLQTGAWVGYDADWRFGPVSVVVQAWLDGGVVVSWKPVHFHGELWLHGQVELRVFGFGLGLHVDARFATDVVDPFHILADFSVGISLPWPLPDFDIDITLEWGPEPNRPPLPLPLKEVAIEHFHSTASWPLARGTLLLPDRDAGGGMLALPAVPADLAAPAPADAPVVPLDARPRITFGRSVHDDALVGVNPQPILPNAVPAGWERIGDPSANQGPMRVRYALREVSLDRWNGASWDVVARKGATANPTGVRELFGSWAPVPALPAGLVAAGTDPPIDQTKLWLWSRTPFDYTRYGGSAWDDWFTDAYTGYPCPPPAQDTSFCVDVDDRREGQTLSQPVTFAGHPQLRILGPVPLTVVGLTIPVAGHHRALAWTVGRTPLELTVIGTPADEMRLWPAAASPGSERHCVSFRDVSPGSQVPLPYSGDGIAVVLPGQSTGTVRRFDPVTGLVVGQRADVALPCPASEVDVIVGQFGGFVRVVARDEAGATVAAGSGHVAHAEESIRLTAVGIVAVQVFSPNAETLLVAVCADCATEEPLQAVGIDDDGTAHGPFSPTGGVITVPVTRLRRVLVQARRGALAQICVRIPPDPDSVTAILDMTQHLIDAMARYTEEGAVLEPDSVYRLQITTRFEAVGEDALAGVSDTEDLTELAYFRTQGPPALTTLALPVGQNAATFRSGLDDLTRYVGHTVPATGEAALQPTRPVFRAYDVGVVFIEDYVDLMYRAARRDLALQLYDVNNRPVRDPLGRVIVAANRWGHTESVQLSDSERRYVIVIDGVRCVVLDQAVIPHHVTLVSGDDGQVLAPDTVHEARLVPLLLHEDFTTGLARWTVVDGGDQQAPSAWAVRGHPTLTGTGASAAGAVVTLSGAGDLSVLDPGVDAVRLATDTARPGKTYRIVSVDSTTTTVVVDGTPILSGGASAWEVAGFGRLVQTSNIWGGTVDGDDPIKPGTTIVTGDGTWADYRVTVQVRSDDNDAVGVVFRWNGPHDHYRFSMDSERGYRRLVRIVAGAHTVLGEDDFTYIASQDYQVTIEAIGAELAVYLDGNSVFRVSDASFAHGGVGLYCWADQDAWFSDVRVNDLSASAPLAYRFSFTTSRYATFAHLLASAEGHTWALDGADGAVSTALATAVPLGAPTSDREQRAYDDLAAAVFGGAAARLPERVETSLIRVGGEPRALLVRSPEPIDWARTALQITLATAARAPGDAPGTVALRAVAPAGASPNDETVSLILGELGSLAGTEVQRYAVPGGLAPDEQTTLFDDGFGGTAGILLDEHFSPGALRRFTILDSGIVNAPSAWSVSSGELHQFSSIWGGSTAVADPNKPGTLAVTGGHWSDATLGVTARSLDDDAIGVVIRCTGPGDYYLFTMDAKRGYRRLVRWLGGVATTLWEDASSYVVGQSYRMELTAVGDTLIGTLDGAALFVVHDTAHAAGQVGLYCWANQDAHFADLRVEARSEPPVSWRPPFATTDEVAIVNETDQDGPSTWATGGGKLFQTAPIGATAGQRGTSALSRPAFTEYRVQMRARADDGAFGLVFGYVDTHNWFRLHADHVTGTRRLVRSIAGTVVVLWDEPGPSFGPSVSLELAAEVAGGRLRCWMDGALVVDVPIEPAVEVAGRVGAWAWRCPTLAVSSLLVLDRARRVGSWSVRDDLGAGGGPSTWAVRGGALRQDSAIGASTEPAALGTVATTGASWWRDYRTTVTVRAHAGAVGLVVRRRDAANFYRLSLAPADRRLVAVVDGIATTLWQDSGGYAPDRPLPVTLDAIDDRLVGYVGGTRLFDLRDATHSAGGVGLYTALAERAQFTGLRVSTPPRSAVALWRDAFGAGDMSAWSVVDESTAGGPAMWALTGGELVQSSNAYTLPLDAVMPDKHATHAVVGDPAWRDVVLSVRLRSDDDDAIGVLFRYADANNYYRFSMDAQRGYRRLVRTLGDVVTVLWQDDVAYTVGREYELVIAAVGSRLRSWIDGIPVFDVDDPTLPEGRVGAYCWADEGARFRSVAVYPASAAFADWIFSDDFSGLDTTRWTYLDAPGTVDGTSTWTFADGELRQTSAITAGDDGEAALPGTLAIAGDPAWSDYRFTVAIGSDSGGAIGAIFRYTDAEHWYRFAADASVPYRRLTTCVGGAVTELWSDAGLMPAGRLALLTIDAVGDSLSGYLDGVELFTLHDATHPTGRVGLYCRRNPTARFGSAEVAPARWVTHVRFAPDEPSMAAGTEVRVHSGNTADWTAAPLPGVRDRFLAGPGDPGKAHLPADQPIWLRVVDRAGAPGHQRRFLPAADFAPVAGAAMLRRADGCGFAVTAPGSPLASGTYRLTLTYRRDNTAHQPGSDILSRAGDTTDEVVLLDVDT